ncbi:MAG: hypothetical protein ACO3QA_05280, partial [Phycisphaerales bacterium]
HDEVTDDAWARADGIVTYRGTAAVMAALPKLQRARIVVRGGVGFATPEDGGARVADGARFELHEAPEKGWLEW